MDNDILRVTREANESFPWFQRLSETRQDVVLCMIFNLGLKGFSEFKRMIAALERQDWGLAASEMLASRWSSQVGKRAVELAELMRS